MNADRDRLSAGQELLRRVETQNAQVTGFALGFVTGVVLILALVAGVVSL